MFLSMGIEAIVSLIPINLHLQKIGGRSQLRAHSLSSNHILCSLISPSIESLSYQHPLLLNSLTRKQYDLIKGHLVDMKNRFNEVFPFFDLINLELFPGHIIIDSYANHFSFHFFTKWVSHNIKPRVQELDKITIELLDDPSIALIVTDASVKNNVTTSIAYIHVQDKPIMKTFHHTLNIMSTKAELIAIRCGINQATSIDNISKIIIVMDSIHTVKKIFNLSSHPFQKHAVSILKELCSFFYRHPENHIKFWECSSYCNWHLHKVVNIETKSLRPTPIFPNKLSWDFSKKLECNDLANNLLKPSYIRGGLWLQNFGHSNSLCIRATRAITNHAPIGEYRLRFFLNREFRCLCGQYPIESRQHILHGCRRYNKYWNPRRDSINHFIMFLKQNPNAFAFANAIT